MSQKTKQQNKEAAKDAGVKFTSYGWIEYEYWRANDPKIHEAISRLINECVRTPFEGLGKPEPLKGDLSGYWSRRITQEHRLVYCYEGGVLTVINCRFHY